MTKDNFNFEWASPNHGGSRACGDNSIRVSINKGGNKKYQIAIRINIGVMRAQRWVCGDKISVGFDLERNAIAVKRTPNKGYSLSATSVTKEQRDQVIGTHAPCVVKLTAPQALVEIITDSLVIGFDECIERDGLLIIPLTDQLANQDNGNDSKPSFV
jgi:hypothetical protein